MLGEPFESVEAAVVEDRCLEEIDHFFVLGVIRAVAGDVKGREACGVL